ncbi:DJ-1/PfpI family protein [Caproiciproducens sp.]|uniref:DJ-1/PfpI family protein n=1 Tax=Caproiciproducens sp. TaxID=1954376 RepID=UPI002897123A|nr:DJ-1/PfpI family protein [Caproiciproducens sp.]
MNIQVILFDGFDPLDAIAPYEVFTAASMYSKKEIIVEFVSAEGRRMVQSGNGMQLQAEGEIDLSKKGMIVLPGACGSTDENSPNSLIPKIINATKTKLIDFLADALNDPEIICVTVCGGSLILALAGLLVGRHVVTHHMGMGLLSTTDAIPVKARTVDDNDLVSSGGVTSGLDVALYMVEREIGPAIAIEVEKLFEFERRGTVWKATGENPITLAISTDNEENPMLSERAMQLTQEDVTGKWFVDISTPIGKMCVELNLWLENGKLIGLAKQEDDTLPLEEVKIANGRLTWVLKTKKPLPLKLLFDVTIEVDTISGSAKAGALPKSKISGYRMK